MSVEQYRRSGFSKLEAGDYQGAIRDFDSALSITPGHGETLENRGEAKLMLGDYEGSVQDFNDAYSYAGYSAKENMILRGYTRFEKCGNYQCAVKYYGALLNVYSDSKEIWKSVMEAKDQLGDYRGVIADFNEFVCLNPRQASCDLTVIGQHSADKRRAIAYFDAVLNIDPNYIQARRNRMEAKFELGAHHDVIQDFNDFVLVDKKAAIGAIWRLIPTALESKDYQVVIAYASVILEVDPNFPAPFFYRAKAKKALYDYQGALEDFDIFLRQEPESDFVLRDCAETRHALGDYVGEIRILDVLIGINPHNYNTKEFLILRGIAKYELNNYHEAVEDFEAAIQSDPLSRVGSRLGKSSLGDPGDGYYRAAIEAIERSASFFTGTPSIETSYNSITSSVADCSNTLSHALSFNADSSGSEQYIIPYRDIFFPSDTQELGRGTFGVVKKALWLGRDVAVKELLPRRLSSDVTEEFITEAGIHTALNHKNIVKLYGICIEIAHYCLVMELMPEGSLFDVLHSDAGKALPWDMRLNLALDVASGLAYLHEQCLMHRDLKSPNVLVRGQGGQLIAKLSDFGMAKVKIESGSISTAGGGTLRWMAPELLLEDDARRSYASDVFALGIILWEIKTNKTPFETVVQALVGVRIMQGKRDDIPLDTPRQYASLIATCWAERAEDRPLASTVVEILPHCN